MCSVRVDIESKVSKVKKEREGQVKSSSARSSAGSRSEGKWREE